jgi:co-chaperonin GroES (HSP10)
MKLFPCNKYLCVTPLEEEGEDSGLVFSAEVQEASPFTMAIVEAKAYDCLIEASDGEIAICNTHGIQEVSADGETYYVVPEHHVIGILSEDDED